MEPVRERIQSHMIWTWVESAIIDGRSKKNKKNIGIDTLWNMCRAVPCESVCVCVCVCASMPVRPSLKEQCCFCMPYIAQCKCVSLHVDVVSFSSSGQFCGPNSCRGFHGCVCFIMVFVLCVSETGIFGGS